MEFYCEDLPLHGVVLIPPSSPDYDSLLADIQRRIDHPVAGSPPIPESMQARIWPSRGRLQESHQRSDGAFGNALD
jgi:hypothetical protein